MRNKNKEFEHQLTVDSLNGDPVRKEREKRLEAIQHHEIEMPIYIDNLISFLFSPLACTKRP